MFDEFDDAEALAVMLEAAVIFHEAVEDGLAFVAEGGMAEVVGQGDGFAEVFVEAEGAGDVAGDGGDFHGVGEAGAEVVPGAIKEDLGFVFEAAEGAGVNHPVAVPLIMRAPFGRRFPVLAPARVGAELGIRGQALAFEQFQFLSCAGHA